MTLHKIQHPNLKNEYISYGFFTRNGGFSEHPFNSLNCSFNVNDKENDVKTEEVGKTNNRGDIVTLIALSIVGGGIFLLYKMLKKDSDKPPTIVIKITVKIISNPIIEYGRYVLGFKYDGMSFVDKSIKNLPEAIQQYTD